MQSTKAHNNRKIPNGKVEPSAARAENERDKPAPGSRLAAAFEAVEKFPVLMESRARVVRAATAETARVSEVIEAVESDVGLAIAVMRFANRSIGAASAVGTATRPEPTPSSSTGPSLRTPRST